MYYNGNAYSRVSRTEALGAQKANRDPLEPAETQKEIGRKVAELRINAAGSKPPSWRSIREKLNLGNDEFHKGIRLEHHFRESIVERIESFEDGWECKGKLEILLGFEPVGELAKRIEACKPKPASKEVAHRKHRHLKEQKAMKKGYFEGNHGIMNDNVSNAIFTLEQEVLKTLLNGPLTPIEIAEFLGVEAIPRRPDGSRTNTSNHLITGILFGLEQKGFVEQHRTYGPWALTHSGRRNIQ